MADELTPSKFLNPMMQWADMGLRALEMSVSSTQNLGDSLDRMARAGASTEITDAQNPAVAVAPASAGGSRQTLATQMQRSTFDLMTQNWLQWMSTLGAFASMAAGRTVALETLRWGVQAASAAEAPATQSRFAESPRQQGGSSRESHAEPRSTEHAVASAGSQRRRTTTTKAKRKPRSRDA